MDDRLTVLVIDDDPHQLVLMKRFCAKSQFPLVEYMEAATVSAAELLIHNSTVDLVITDYRLPDGNGLEVLRMIKALNPEISVVVITAFEDTRQAVQLLANGADDYLIKPIKYVDMERILIRVFETHSLTREDRISRQEINEKLDSKAIIFQSREMLQVLSLAYRSSHSDATVLISGESGTGKELMAKLIHISSRRKDKPFVTVNISVLPEGLIESTLFGHKKGSFTDAINDRTGLFEVADQGTLFIDEVGDIPLSVQIKLLRVLQFGEITRLGENSIRRLDVRIIAATNKNLARMVQRHQFREDLFHRVNVIPIHIPPLRERKSDIPSLIEHFIGRFNEKNGKNIRSVSREAMDMIMKYSFPGNVRELENIVERGVVLCRGDIILRRDLLNIGVEEEPKGSHDPFTLDAGYEVKMNAYEEALLTTAMDKAGGNQSEAARLLNISERRLRYRIKRLRIANPWKNKGG